MPNEWSRSWWSREPDTESHLFSEKPWLWRVFIDVYSEQASASTNCWVKHSANLQTSCLAEYSMANYTPSQTEVHLLWIEGSVHWMSLNILFERHHQVLSAPEGYMQTIDCQQDFDLVWCLPCWFWDQKSFQSEDRSPFAIGCNSWSLPWFPSFHAKVGENCPSERVCPGMASPGKPCMPEWKMMLCAESHVCSWKQPTKPHGWILH